MKKTLLLAAAFLPVLAGCDRPAPQTDATTAPAALGEAVATVNGKPIYKAELDNLSGEIAQRGMAGEVTQERLLDELISRELLRQEAESKKIDSDPETAARLSNIRRAILSQAAAQNYTKANPLSEEALKQEYDQRVAASKETEYKARHILVKTEAEAKDIIAKLDKGGKFEELAKAKSTDGSAKEGGDLGWFGPQQMVEPFSQAVIALENGKYTTTPVQTQFGWHVILREETRGKAAPPFEMVKEQLRHMLQTQTMQKHVDELRAGAQIAKTLPPAPAPAAEVTPPTAAAPPQAAPAPAAANAQPEASPAEPATPAH
ncbi:MAG TPA: peptidylprolyl isomerase [Methylococcaceae bacterium]|nr:peptidylprolyl isomerase [Methylococcaceae bacterium]